MAGNPSAPSRRLGDMNRIVVVAVLALLGAACGAGERIVVGEPTSTSTTVPPGATAQLEALAEARQVWAAAAPVDYTIELQDRCPDCSPGLDTLAVRDGEVLSLALAERITVDELFVDIERALAEGAAVSVDYHEQFGHPTRLVIDRNGDGIAEVDLELADLQAMPVVQTLDELLEARRRWEAQNLDSYRFRFRAECTCPDGGTFDVQVQQGRVTVARPLDEAARSSTIHHIDLDTIFDDLEQWFTDASEVIAAGILAVDVRTDPELGYPRWFHIEAEGVGDGAFEGRFTFVVTIDLVEAIEPGVDEPSDAQGTAEERRQLERARARWVEAAVENYRYVFTLHCNCPGEVTGPFEVTVRGSVVLSVVWKGDNRKANADVIVVEEAFELIAAAIEDGTEVEVEYDEVVGYPSYVIIDPEAVAVDGGLAFSLAGVEPLAPR